MKWTVCKKGKRNSEKLQLLNKSFLTVWHKIFSKLRTFWSKEYKSNWISAWKLAWTFPVFFFFDLLYRIYVKIFNQSVYFKELHNDQEYYWPTTYRTGAAVVSTITRNSSHWTVIRRGRIQCEEKKKINQGLYIIKASIPDEQQWKEQRSNWPQKPKIHL